MMTPDAIRFELEDGCVVLCSHTLGSNGLIEQTTRQLIDESLARRLLGQLGSILEQLASDPEYTS